MLAMYTAWETFKKVWFTLPQSPLHVVEMVYVFYATKLLVYPSLIVLKLQQRNVSPLILLLMFSTIVYYVRFCAITVNAKTTEILCMSI